MSVNDEFVNTKKAAELIHRSEAYLARDRCDGPTGNRTPGPPYYKVGRRILYKVGDLMAWLEKHRVE